MESKSPRLVREPRTPRIALAGLLAVALAGACSSETGTSDGSDDAGASSLDDGGQSGGGGTGGEAGTGSSDGGAASGSSGDTATGSGTQTSGGSDGGSSGSSIQDPFLGEWTQHSGTGTINCGGGAEPLDDGPTGSIEATGTSRLRFKTSPDCVWTFRLSGGRVATFVPDQSCSFDDGDTAVTIRPNRWRLELTGANERLRQDYQAVREETTDASTRTCDLQWSGQLQRQ